MGALTLGKPRVEWNLLWDHFELCDQSSDSIHGGISIEGLEWRLEVKEMQDVDLQWEIKAMLIMEEAPTN